MSCGVVLGICLALLELRFGVKPWAIRRPVLKLHPTPRLRVPRGPQGAVQRGRQGPWLRLLVPDGAVRRDMGRDPATDQSHAHREHFLGGHVTQQAEGRVG